MSLYTISPELIDNCQLDLAIRKAAKMAEAYENLNQHKTAEIYRHHHTMFCAEKTSLCAI